MTRRDALVSFLGVAAAAARPLSDLNGSKVLTLRLRMTEACPVRLHDSAGADLVTMTPRDGALEVAFFLDSNKDPLRLRVPASAFVQASQHDIVLRYAGHKLDLFCDGVLVDEEWPMGSLRAQGDVTLEASCDASAEKRAVPDAELFPRPADERRAAAILGPARSVSQYWHPRGINVGDVMPFYHGGRFHVFYLYDRRHHGSKWHRGAHQWAHMSSTDLSKWEHHPMALRIDAEWECSICTGSLFFDGGTHYAFYATRMPDGSEHLAMAASRDCIHFEKLQPTPFDEPAPPYKRGPNRDPFVWKSGSGRYNMIVCAELAAPRNPMRGGALELLESADLRHWTQRAPFYIPGYIDAQPECPDIFEWNGRHYLLFGIDGATHYRIGASPSGPWTVPEQDVIDCPQSRVMKTAAFGNNRRIGVSFVPENGYGGDMLFREIVQLDGGTLGTRTPPEFALPAREAIAVPAPLHIESRGEYAAQTIPAATGDLRVRCRVEPTGGLCYGLALDGIELRLTAGQRRVEWRTEQSHPSDSSTDATIECVDSLAKSVLLDVTVRGNLFDVCLNGDRTLIARHKRAAERPLSFWVHGGSLTITDLRIERV